MRLGRHCLIDGHGSDPALLDDVVKLVAIITHAAHASGANVLHVGHHKFSPQGVTVFALLAESHASIHTYPEHGVWMADVFTCGDHTNPGEAVRVMLKAFGGTSSVTEVHRPHISSIEEKG